MKIFAQNSLKLLLNETGSKHLRKTTNPYQQQQLRKLKPMQLTILQSTHQKLSHFYVSSSHPSMCDPNNSKCAIMLGGYLIWQIRTAGSC
jgi:hypothetical protein